MKPIEGAVPGTSGVPQDQDSEIIEVSDDEDKDEEEDEDDVTGHRGSATNLDGSTRRRKKQAVIDSESDSESDEAEMGLSPAHCGDASVPGAAPLEVGLLRRRHWPLPFLPHADMAPTAAEIHALRESGRELVAPNADRVALHRCILSLMQAAGAGIDPAGTGTGSAHTSSAAGATPPSRTSAGLRQVHPKSAALVARLACAALGQNPEDGADQAVAAAEESGAEAPTGAD